MEIYNKITLYPKIKKLIVFVDFGIKEKVINFQKCKTTTEISDIC